MAEKKSPFATAFAAARKYLFAVVIPAAIVVLNIGVTSAVLAPLQERFGDDAAYAIHFLYGFLPAAIALSVKHLAGLVRMDRKPERRGLAYASWLFLRELLARGLIYYTAWEHDQKMKFSQGWREKLKRYGALPAAVIVAVPVAPYGSAVLMRVMAVPEIRAWIYVALSAIANTTVIAYGGLPALKALFG